MSATLRLSFLAEGQIFAIARLEVDLVPRWRIFTNKGLSLGSHHAIGANISRTRPAPGLFDEGTLLQLSSPSTPYHVSKSSLPQGWPSISSSQPLLANHVVPNGGGAPLQVGEARPAASCYLEGPQRREKGTRNVFMVWRKSGSNSLSSA